MCYYNSQRVSRAEFIRLLHLERAVKNYDFLNAPLQDGFSYGQVAVLKPTTANDNFDIVQMEWGLIPSHLKNRETVKLFRTGYKDAHGTWHKGFTTLNATAEHLFINEDGRPSMFRFAAKERRCVVLSTGFYEWQHILPVNKRTGLPVKTAVKYPYFITVKDQEYCYMAGIWQAWTDKDTGEYVETVAVITAPANGLMTTVHNSRKRMPTILNDDLAFEWMMGDLPEARITEIALTRYPSHLMQAYPIDKGFKASEEPTAPYFYPAHEVPVLPTVFAD